MAIVTPITLSGGIKSTPRHDTKVITPSAPISPAHAAFEALTDALAEAIAAEEFRADPASWDPAYAEHDAEVAVEAVINAAREAGEATVIIKSDRMMVYAARFVSCAMSLEDGGDRENILHFMNTNQSLFGHSGGGLIARQANGLVGLAFERLLRLNGLLYSSNSEPTLPGEHDESFAPGC